MNGEAQHRKARGLNFMFCRTQVVMHTAKLDRISLSSENSLGLSHAYSADFCQQSCTGQKHEEV